MPIQIPNSFDPEWQAKLLRRLSFLLGKLLTCNEEDKFIYVTECNEIVDALREYSGY